MLGNVIAVAPERCVLNLCADKGYTGEPPDETIRRYGYIPHVMQRNQEAKAIKEISGFKARRWVVEVTHSWYNRFRKLLVRYEKYEYTYEALLHLASAIICWRNVGVIYG